MEFKEIIGRRRTIRFFDPDKPVEREKIQIMFEASPFRDPQHQLNQLFTPVRELFDFRSVFSSSAFKFRVSARSGSCCDLIARPALANRSALS